MANLSAKMLFWIVFSISFVGVVVLCSTLFAAGQRAEIQLMATIEARLLATLEESGLSGLAVQLGRIDRALVPGTDRIAVAVWRVRPNVRTLVLETEPGAAAGFETGNVQIVLDDTNFRVRRVDVAAASENWTIRMNDIDLWFGVETPSADRWEAQRTAITIGAAYALAVMLAALLQSDHARRYRRGVVGINQILDRHAAGETDLRIEGPMPAPELRALGDHINTVMPKMDTLLGDLRASAAHLAHELVTPLTKVRISADEMRDTTDEQKRQATHAAIKQELARATGQLTAVMQLFRLRADEPVELTDTVNLEDLLTDSLDFWEEVLTEQDRKLTLDIEQGVTATGNEQLLGLVLENLFQNVAKYAEARAEIHVELKSLSPGFLLGIENTAPSSARFSSDLTERYKQGGDPAKRQGAGLGLCLVAAIADRHGFTFRLFQVEREGQGPMIRAELSDHGGGRQ